MNIWKFYLRWRHSKGYGVHSPFAYRFITDVLNPGDYGYYAYHQLTVPKGTLKTGKQTFLRESKFLVRLANFLNCKRFITYGMKYPVAQFVARVLKIKYYNCDDPDGIIFKPGDLLMLTPDALAPEELIEKALKEGVSVMAEKPSREIRSNLEKPLLKGVCFSGESKILVIPRQEMQYVSYSIKM